MFVLKLKHLLLLSVMMSVNAVCDCPEISTRVCNLDNNEAQLVNLNVNNNESQLVNLKIEKITYENGIAFCIARETTFNTEATLEVGSGEESPYTLPEALRNKRMILRVKLDGTTLEFTFKTHDGTDANWIVVKTGVTGDIESSKHVTVSNKYIILFQYIFNLLFLYDF